MAIDCKNYDFVEIACMHRYPIKLTLRDSSIVKGVAIDTQRNNEREECIKIDSGNTEQLIVLDEISIFEVCIDNPHFTHVRFE